MLYQALIFDFDGTLANTMPFHWKAWQRVKADYPFHFTEEQFYSLGGVPSREILGMLSREQNLQLDIPLLAKLKEDSYLDYLDQVQPIEPIAKIVRRHFGLVPMAIASGGRKVTITAALNKIGMAQFFNAVVTTEDVVRQKPAPDIFLEAARRLGVAPQFCQAYEDTDLGLQAIRAAGMTAVDVRQVLASAGQHLPL